jgi:hypothetical protein
LIAVDASKRDEMLSNFNASSGYLRTEPAVSQQAETTNTAPEAVPFRSRSGHLRKLKDGKATEFYGATSFFQISPSDDQDPTSTAELSTSDVSLVPNGARTFSSSLDRIDESQFLAFSPQSDICRHLMATFFQTQYQYHIVSSPGIVSSSFRWNWEL